MANGKSALGSPLKPRKPSRGWGRRGRSPRDAFFVPAREIVLKRKASLDSRGTWQVRRPSTTVSFPESGRSEQLSHFDEKIGKLVGFVDLKRILMFCVTVWFERRFDQLKKMTNFKKLCLVCLQFFIMQVQGKKSGSVWPRWKIGCFAQDKSILACQKGHRLFPGPVLPPMSWRSPFWTKLCY